MKKKIHNMKNHRLFLFSIVTALLLNNSISSAQSQRLVHGERVTCKIKANNKEYQPQLNQIGLFDRVSNIQPLASIPIEISYPDGAKGDRVVISVEDGGILDNGKAVRVIELDKDRKLTFNFQVTDQTGLFRVTLHKGNDFKIIRLWVGPEIPIAQN